MSADPAGPQLMNPDREGYSSIEATNWFSYVSNNPINYVDPTGMELKAYKDFFTDHERAVLRENKISPFKVAMISKKALDTVYEVGASQGWEKAEGWQGRIDALRHTYWNYLLSKELGTDKAELITTMHEDEHPNSPKEKEMDLNNNAFGRSLVDKNSDLNDQEAIGIITSEINSGKGVLWFKDWHKGENADVLTTGQNEILNKIEIKKDAQGNVCGL